MRDVERSASGVWRRALKPDPAPSRRNPGCHADRSPLEDRFQRFCRFYELPPHHANVDVLGSEVDGLWPAAKLIVELDSWEFHRHRAAWTMKPIS